MEVKEGHVNICYVKKTNSAEFGAQQKLNSSNTPEYFPTDFAVITRKINEWETKIKNSFDLTSWPLTMA